MKALVYGGPGIIEFKEVPVPQLTKPTDALIRMTKTTICGTDLGIIKSALVLALLTTVIALVSLWSLNETFHKDLNYNEGTDKE